MSEIPTSLRTGIESIEAEHAQLLSFQQQLIAFCPFQTCEGSDCDESRRAECNAAMTELFSDILIFMVDHFRKEEMAMRQHRLDLLDRPACEGHREAHAEITEHARHLIADLSPQSVLSNVHDLAGLLDGWIGDHVADHDHRLLGLLGVEHHEPGAVARASAN